MSFQDDDDEPLETEEELRESYPWMYGGNEKPYEPPAIRLNAEQQKVLDTKRAEIIARNEVVDEHGENYHYIRKITDEMLPTLNFRVFDNLFLARPASAFLGTDEPQKPRVTRRLFSDFWQEGELAVLFADTGCGKSLLAMQIAWALAGGPQFAPFEMDVEPDRVLYFDFELSKDQFDNRYSPDDPNVLRPEYPFPATLIRCPPQQLDALPPGHENVFEFLIHSIVDLVERSEAKFVVIDNITWLGSSIESSPAALRLMKTLVQLKHRLGISILVLAHTPKSFSRTPLTVAHLHGSKMLSNFADSIFALGSSRQGKDIRYVKGIKHRSAVARETSTEVATLKIEKRDWFLGFTFERYSDERAHVGWSYGTALAAEFAEHVERLSERGLTQREIAADLGVSQSTVYRCLKARDQGKMPVSV